MMMTTTAHLAQLFTRIALGIGFLFPVLDRLGFAGPPGQAAWGDWSHFVAYTHSLMPFLSLKAAHVAGLAATLAECVLGICLIAGFKVKWMGLGAAFITLIFGISMMAFLGISAPFRYPVFVFTGAGLLLYSRDTFKWSIDAAFKKH